MVLEKYINEKIDKDGSLKEISFNIPDDFNFGYDVVDSLAKTCPDKRAMVWVGADKRDKVFTFSEMSEKSNRAANYFSSLGIRSGDRVMIILKRHYNFWFSIIALHKLGAVVIPATHQLMAKDIVYRVNKAGIKAIVCTSDDGIAGEIEKAVPECPTLKTKIITKVARADWEFFETGLENASDKLDRVPTYVKDEMILYFSSGTTGYPKIVTHDFSYPIGHIVTARWWQSVVSDAKGLHFTISDTGWGKAVWGKLYGQWLCEACVFTYDFDKFCASDILPMFEKYNITTFCAPPTMYRMLMKENAQAYNLKSLRHCTIAGEALNPEVFKQWQDLTGLKMMEGFGQTETTVMIAALRGMTPKPGSMGKPTPQYDVRILTPDGVETKDGEIGEICISTSAGNPVGLFKEYDGEPEKTAEQWHDGFYHTGDTAWRDEDGYLWYVGRTDDLIKSSGYRIGPFEIESVIAELPYVFECAVIGVPDEVRGQLVKAFIILKPDQTPSEILKKEVQEYVKEHTAPYKYPRIIEFVESLPKTISGKIMRKDLK